MKNIHLIPTDKSSRLYIGDNGNFVLGLMKNSIQSRNDYYTNQHIYITSDEDIKMGDYYCSPSGIISKHNGTEMLPDDWNKIILTTDQDLIADGVQAIDDELLEWFVQNPSCEEVEIETDYLLWKNSEKEKLPDFTKYTIKNKLKKHLVN